MRILLFLYLIISSSLFLSSNVEWLTETSHEFGDIPHREAVHFDFKFKNLNDAPISIDNVRTTCGCTVPDWNEAPILPDSTGVITVEYDARDVGYFKKRIKVYFSGQRKAEKLWIEGFVEGEEE